MLPLDDILSSSGDFILQALKDYFSFDLTKIFVQINEPVSTIYKESPLSPWLMTTSPDATFFVSIASITTSND
jgi:hypothetical protein